VPLQLQPILVWLWICGSRQRPAGAYHSTQSNARTLSFLKDRPTSPPFDSNQRENGQEKRDAIYPAKMVPQVLRNRYIEKARLTQLLQRLFGTDWRCEVRCPSFSQTMPSALLHWLIEVTLQDQPEHYAIEVPRQLTLVCDILHIICVDHHILISSSRK
jgi:hypothetical protein